MTIRQAFVGMLQLFAVGFSLAVGLFLVGVYFVPELAFALENTLLIKPKLFVLSGLASIGFSGLLGVGFYFTSYGRTLLLRMGTSVDVKLIHHTIEPLFYRQFADRIVLRDVQVLRGKELMIGLRLASMNPEEREKLLSEAERHLQTLLIERFGFSQPFTVQVSL
jgi:hypothetical protein